MRSLVGADGGTTGAGTRTGTIAVVVGVRSTALGVEDGTIVIDTGAGTTAAGTGAGAISVAIGAEAMTAVGDGLLATTRLPTGVLSTLSSLVPR